MMVMVIVAHPVGMSLGQCGDKDSTCDSHDGQEFCDVFHGFSHFEEVRPTIRPLDG